MTRLGDKSIDQLSRLDTFDLEEVIERMVQAINPIMTRRKANDEWFGGGPHLQLPEIDIRTKLLAQGPKYVDSTTRLAEPVDEEANNTWKRQHQS